MLTNVNNGSIWSIKLKLTTKRSLNSSISVFVFSASRIPKVRFHSFAWNFTASIMGIRFTLEYVSN